MEKFRCFLVNNVIDIVVCVIGMCVYGVVGAGRGGESDPCSHSDM